MFAVFGIMITSEAGAVLRHSICIHFPVSPKLDFYHQQKMCDGSKQQQPKLILNETSTATN